MEAQEFPPLEELVAEIDQLTEKYPDSYSLNEYESVMASQRRANKRRGNQFIRFSIHETQLALPLKYALEIIAIPDITPLPNLPNWILGICNVRGEIVAIVDIAQLLQIQRRKYGGPSNIILLQIGQMKLAFWVDRIGGIFFDGDPETKVEEKKLADAALSQFARCTYISNQQEVHLLEVNKLLPALKTK
ncbi:MAG: chemotaxis protein CheW [Desulfobacteraceae bacterium]|jgi:chemotaxis signal transduction protein